MHTHITGTTSLTGTTSRRSSAAFAAGCKHTLPCCTHTTFRHDQTEIKRFFCYSADAAIALADLDKNPGGKVQFIFMSRGEQWCNAPLHSCKQLVVEHAAAGLCMASPRFRIA